MRLRIVAAPERYIDSLAPLPKGAEISSLQDEPFASVQLFVTSADALNLSARKLLRDAGERTLVWVAYPKLGSRCHYATADEIVLQFARFKEMGSRKGGSGADIPKRILNVRKPDPGGGPRY